MDPSNPGSNVYRGERGKVSAFVNPPLNKYMIPRPCMTYMAPIDRGVDNKKGPELSGMKSFISSIHIRTCEHPIKIINVVNFTSKKCLNIHSAAAESRSLRLAAKNSFNKENLQRQLSLWRPKDEINYTSDPFKTIFVGRLSFKTDDKSLRHEFEYYGPIQSIRMISKKNFEPEKNLASLETDENSPNLNVFKSRGYAFIEFEREKDAKEAFMDADGRKIDGRRVVVDFERGRTVNGWKPRRLGGGLGNSRGGGKDVNQRESGRDSRVQRLSTPIGVSVNRGTSTYPVDRRESTEYSYRIDRGKYDRNEPSRFPDVNSAPPTHMQSRRQPHRYDDLYGSSTGITDDGQVSSKSSTYSSSSNFAKDSYRTEESEPKRRKYRDDIDDRRYDRRDGHHHENDRSYDRYSDRSHEGNRDRYPRSHRDNIPATDRSPRRR